MEGKRKEDLALRWSWMRHDPQHHRSRRYLAMDAPPPWLPSHRRLPLPRYPLATSPSHRSPRRPRRSSPPPLPEAPPLALVTAAATGQERERDERPPPQGKFPSNKRGADSVDGEWLGLGTDCEDELLGGMEEGTGQLQVAGVAQQRVGEG